MVIFKIAVEILGERLVPEDLLGQLKGDFELSFKISADERTGASGKYGFGCISLLHPRKYGFSNNLIDYEEWFVCFLEKNFHLIDDSGAEDITLLIDVFFIDQCSISIFNKDLLRRLLKFEISIPMNIYKIEREEMLEMLLEEGFNEPELWELNM